MVLPEVKMYVGISGIVYSVRIGDGNIVVTQRADGLFDCEIIWDDEGGSDNADSVVVGCPSLIEAFKAAGINAR